MAEIYQFDMATKDDLISGIGDTCGVNEDCEHTMNTKCANKVCVCVDNYYVLDKQCVKGDCNPQLHPKKRHFT